MEATLSDDPKPQCELITTGGELERPHPVFNPALPLIKRRRAKLVEEMLELDPRHRLLDLGASGDLKSRSEVGLEVLIDIGELDSTLETHTSGHSRKPTAESIPFPDRHFDRAVCSETMTLLGDPRTVLVELHRVLAFNGLVVLSVGIERALADLPRITSRMGLLGYVSTGLLADYLMPAKAHEIWAAHPLSEKRFRKLSADLFRVRRLVGIPNQTQPLAYVAQLVHL